MVKEQETSSSSSAVKDSTDDQSVSGSSERLSYWRRAREVYDDDTIAAGPTDDEVEEWAERERSRRQRWAEGPTEEEKMAWALRQHRRRPARAGTDDDHKNGGERGVRRTSREAELAALGVWDLFMEFPYMAWDRLVEEGRDRESEFFRTRRRHRVRYDDD